MRRILARWGGRVWVYLFAECGLGMVRSYVALVTEAGPGNGG